MNAISIISNLFIANKIASPAALFRRYFADAKVRLIPWDNPNQKDRLDTLDFLFYFPIWRPNIEVRAVLLQLRIENNNENAVPKFLLVII